MALPVKNRMQTHAIIPTVRLGKQLNDEKRDSGDGHGAANSLIDFCRGQGGEGGILGGGTDHSFESWGAAWERLVVCAGQKMGTGTFPVCAVKRFLGGFL